MALQNYPLLKQQGAVVNSARAHEQSVTGDKWPALLLQDQLDKGTVNSLAGVYFPAGIIPSVSGGSTGSGSGNLSAANIGIAYLDWEFFNFGYYGALQEAAKAQSKVATSNLDADQYLVAQGVILLYIDWLKKFRLLQIRKDDLKRDSVVLSAIRANVASGLRPGVDSSTALAVYSGARIAFLKAEDEYNIDAIRLGGYVGKELANMMPDSSAVSARALPFPEDKAMLESVPEDHPLLRVFLNKIEAQEAERKSISRQYMPRLDINGAYWTHQSGVGATGAYADGKDVLNFGMPNSAYNYLFGLTATFNVADLKHRHDRLIESNYRVEAGQQELQGEELELATALKETESSLRKTQLQLLEIPVQRQAAYMAYTQQIALYRAGLNTLIDLTNAQYALLQAETNFVVTQTELLRLKAVRAGLTGNQQQFLLNFKNR